MKASNVDIDQSKNDVQGGVKIQGCSGLNFVVDRLLYSNMTLL